MFPYESPFEDLLKNTLIKVKLCELVAKLNWWKLQCSHVSCTKCLRQFNISEKLMRRYWIWVRNPTLHTLRTLRIKHRVRVLEYINPSTQVIAAWCVARPYQANPQRDSLNTLISSFPLFRLHPRRDGRARPSAAPAADSRKGKLANQIKYLILFQRIPMFHRT